MFETDIEKRFLLVSILPHTITDDEAFKDLKESKALVEAYGGKVIEFVIQRREIHDKGMYIGKGKLEEIVDMILPLKISVVVLNDMVKPGQIYEVQKILEKKNHQIKVWDRVDLILEIFAKHAYSAEAKLQIEIASMKHMGPRIYGMGFVLSRQGGGIGTLGVGETNTELMKRHFRDQMKKIQDKLKKHTIDREKQMEQRLINGLQTVSIVGYTNAGKTSLFNTLTSKKNVVNNALFVTLDSSSGKVFLQDIKKEILFTDTIGFIRNLPTSLIQAFKSTLLESIYADILLHVIDVSDDEMDKKISVVEKVLDELHLGDKKRIYVFNKIDAAEIVDKEAIKQKYGQFLPQFISVKNKKGIEDLLQVISRQLAEPQPVKKALKRRIHI